MSDKKKIELEEKLSKLSEKEKDEFATAVAVKYGMTLPNGKKIIFTNEQYEGIEKIRAWLETNHQFFTLSGYAGTGKSTIIKKIIDGFWGNLVVSAPTHKAKKVIMWTTGQDGITLHSLLGLRPDLDLEAFNPNDPTFNPIAPPTMEKFRLVIIDEASMINEELFEMLKNEASKFHKVKIIFMGDSAQIPPVHEKASAVFQSDMTIKHELVKVMRQADGNPLFPFYDKLRNNLNDPYGGFSRETNLNDKGEGVIFTNDKKLFRENLIDKFTSDEFIEDYDFAKLIAWRNVTVMLSNHIIRDVIYGKDVNILEIGDVLMGYRSIRHDQLFINIIENSCDYRIIKISERLENEYNIFGYNIKMQEMMNNGKYHTIEIFIIDHSDVDNLHVYAEIQDALKIIAKASRRGSAESRRNWKKYYGFRRKNILMVTIKTFKDGSTRMYGDVIAKDIDYGYAITCHKAQGSTYEHVFILEDDISANPVTRERNQIKYVALTRPSKTATVLTNLP